MKTLLKMVWVLLSMYKNADRPETEEGLQYHLKVKPGDLKGTVLLPGDPKRSQRIAEMWDESRKVAEYRQYVSYTGKYKGVDISVTSTGIGPSGTEIAMTELATIGVKDVIRVGSTGALKEEINIGDVVISTAAVRLEDTSKHYVRESFPAFPDYEVTLALIEAAETLNIPYHLGVTASSSSFYAGQERPALSYESPINKGLVQELQAAGVANFEMEASLIFVLAHLFGMRSGSVCVVYANRVTGEFEVKGEENAIRVANEAVKILAEITEEKKANNKKHWYRTLKA